MKQLQERSDPHLNLADYFPIVVSDMLNGNLRPILMQLLHLCMSACLETWQLLLPVFVKHTLQLEIESIYIKQ